MLCLAWQICYTSVFLSSIDDLSMSDLAMGVAIVLLNVDVQKTKALESDAKNIFGPVDPWCHHCLR